MATFFGEILPVTSRALDEDDDDDDFAAATSVSFVRWTPEAQKEIDESPNKCIRCSTVIIADGPAATAFCQVNIMEQPAAKLAVICSGMGDRDVNTFSQSAPTDKACYVYRLLNAPDVIVVMCNTAVTSEQSFSWTNELFKHLNKQHTYVAVLGTLPASDYKSEASPGDLKTPLLRALRTDPFKGTPLCPYLEQPNVLTGLPAQILTYCKVHQVAAVVYMCYVESMLFIDSDTLNLFKKVLRSTPFKDVCTNNLKADDQLTHIMEAHANLNPLYT